MQITKICLACIFAAIAFSPSIAASPQEERIISAVRKAFETPSPKSLLEVICWDGVPDRNKELTIECVNLMFDKPRSVDHISIRPATVKEAEAYSPPGAPFHFKTTDPKLVEVIQRIDKHTTASHVFPLYEKKGKLYLIFVAYGL